MDVVDVGVEGDAECNASATNACDVFYGLDVRETQAIREDSQRDNRELLGASREQFEELSHGKCRLATGQTYFRYAAWEQSEDLLVDRGLYLGMLCRRLGAHDTAAITGWGYEESVSPGLIDPPNNHYASIRI